MPDIPFFELDILDTSKLKEAMSDVDIVFHTAALPYEGLSVFSPAIVAQNIVGGTVSVASAALHNNVNLLSIVVLWQGTGHKIRLYRGSTNGS